MHKTFTKILITIFFSFVTFSLTENCFANDDGNAQINNKNTAETITAIAVNKTPSPIDVIPSPPVTRAKAAILIDANSGKILAQKDISVKYPPASLTKMMTLYTISQALKNGTINLDSQVRISKNAWQTGGSKMFIKVNTNVSVRDLIQGIIVDSGNDACVAMAEYIAGSVQAFVDIMNTQAQALGMHDTHFTDCTGLPNKDLYSTAHDLALLAQALMRDFPEYYQWYSQKWFAFNGIKQPNRNRLLWRFIDADGIKTGHTPEAGFCLAASAKRNNMRLISIVLGEPSDIARSDDSVSLLSYGFRFFQTQLIYQANAEISVPRIWFAKDKYIALSVNHDLYVTATRKQLENLQISASMPKRIHAPISKNQTVGQLNIISNEQVISTEPLVALTDEPEGGLMRCLFDHAAKFFGGAFGDDSPITVTLSSVNLDQKTIADNSNNTIQANKI